MKGRYNHAVKSVEPLNWEVNARNQFSVTLHAEGVDSAKVLDSSLSLVSGVSGSALLSGTSSSASAPSPAILSSEFSSIQHLIVSTLNISPSLLDRNRRDLRFAFTKYEALQDTTKRLNKMVSDGTWTKKVYIF